MIRFLSLIVIPIFFPNWPFIFDWNSVIPSDGKCFCHFSVSSGTSFGCFLWTRAKNEDNTVLSIPFFSSFLFFLSSSGDDDDSEEEEDVEEAKLLLVLNLPLLLFKLLKLLLLILLLLKKCDAIKRFEERAADILFNEENDTLLKEEKGLSFIHKIYLYRLLWLNYIYYNYYNIICS